MGSHGGADAAVGAEELAALLGEVLPAEQLSAEELSATIYADPDAAVLASAGGGGAVAVAVRGDAGWVTAVAVRRARQRRGEGRALLRDAEAWLRGRGARQVCTGAAAPRYLWPGVDVEAHAAAVALFRSSGYEEVFRTRNHRCSTAFRAPVPAGVEVRRVREADDVAAVLRFAGRAFPHWLDEVTRAIPNGCCHGAFAGGGSCVGFGCHSVNRAGWIGPMATDRAWQGRGVGSAVLGAVCRDLELAELDAAEIAWVGPDRFYERAAGTTVSRRFVVLARDL